MSKGSPTAEEGRLLTTARGRPFLFRALSTLVCAFPGAWLFVLSRLRDIEPALPGLELAVSRSIARTDGRA